MSASRSDAVVPHGYCHCGCGEKTTITPHTDPKRGWVKGRPRRFIRGHSGRTISLEERFSAKLPHRPKHGCWEWTGAVNQDGYGRFVVANNPQRVALAHRASWELLHGPIPRGLQVLHHCDNPPCCNPAHLFLGTQQDNVADMIAKGRRRGFDPKVCPAGHTYDEANTGYSRNRSGGLSRRCRSCDRLRRAAIRAARGLITPEQRSRNGKWAMHVRWHERCGVVNPSCEFCRP